MVEVDPLDDAVAKPRSFTIQPDGFVGTEWNHVRSTTTAILRLPDLCQYISPSLVRPVRRTSDVSGRRRLIGQPARPAGAEVVDATRKT